ncbi:MAG: type II/IV secretion system ATPase subunit [Candidatus Micrarchaeia archaeon]
MKTLVDKFIELLASSKTKATNIRKAAKELGWDEGALEKVAIMLELRGIVKVTYPVNPWESISVQLLREEEIESERPLKEGKVYSQYQINVDGVKADVTVYFSEDEKSAKYNISMPSISPYTRIFIEGVKNEVIKEVPIEVEQITDIEKARRIREDFHRNILGVLDNYKLPQKEKEVLGGILLHEMSGLGDLEMLIADDWLEEVIVNAAEIPVGVYHRKYGWLETNLHIRNEEMIADYSAYIGRKIGRNISSLTPVLDAHLLTGDRVNATLYPVSTRGNTITIRKFARNPWTITNFISPDLNTMSVDMAALLWQAIQYEMNIIIAGGTASGKTTTLNCLAGLIQPYHRIISIEDTREIMLPSYMWNWIPTVTRTPNPEGLGEVSMLELMVTSLRMRPDRIIVGEIRRGKEAEVLFEAMHTGHSVYSTLHADTGLQVIKRLVEPPISVPESEIHAINLLVVQHRDRRLNLRRTMEISEVVPGPEGEPDLNVIYHWRPKTDNFELIREPRRYVEVLNLHTGMTYAEMKEDIENKKKILNYMVEKKVDQLDQVGALMKMYYADPDYVLSGVKKNYSFKKIVGG